MFCSQGGMKINPSLSPLSKGGMRGVYEEQDLGLTYKDTWRRGRDSNPGWSYPHNGFRDRPVQPLWHPSGYAKRLYTESACFLQDCIHFVMSSKLAVFSELKEPV